jgi:threonine/homoserine/homoserine lactone efflux protein
MSLLWTIALTHLIALMSPGPDFILVIRNSLSKSRRDGYFTALGFASGVAFHLTWGLLGLSYLLERFPLFLQILQYGGALYLAYLGWQSWNSSPFQFQRPSIKQTQSNLLSFREGLITNLLNVKAMLFFISLLVNVLTPEIDLIIRLSAVLLMVTLTALWFSLVTRFFTQTKVQQLFLAAQKPIERTLAVILWLLALKLSGLVGVILTWLKL